MAGARSSVEAIQAANREARDLAPRLLSELGDLGSSVGTQKLEGMSRYLERFELMVQRVQQDLNGLSSGVSDAAPAAQRLADSLEFLNQVMRGLSGDESGLALQKVTGADPEQRLKVVVQRNNQYTAAVRKAIGAAEPLARGPGRGAHLAGDRQHARRPAGHAGAEGGPRLRLQAGDHRAAAGRGRAAGRARLGLLQERQLAQELGAAGARERAQPGGHHAPAG